MEAKKLVHKAFAFVFLSGVVGLSLFTRRSYAMDIKSQAPIGYFTPTNEPKDEVTPKLVTVTITPTKQGLEEQSSESEKIPAFSGEQLPSSLPVSTIDVPQQSNVSRYSSSAQSVEPRRSRSISATFKNLLSARGFGGSHRDPSGSGTGRLMARSQSLDSSDDTRYLYCCHKRLPCLEISAARKQFFVDLPTARAKAALWNQQIADFVKPEHKPLPLPSNLKDWSDNPKVFGISEPIHVFSSKDKEGITTHVKELKASIPESSTPEALLKQQKGKGKARVSTVSIASTALNYDTKLLIFDDTVPSGHYIKSLTFIDNYTSSASGAQDNRGHTLKYVSIGNMQGLVNSETAQNHFSTGEHYSSTHADLYLYTRQGNPWPNIADISNHTGIAREATNKTKLKRNATYNLNS